MTRGRPPKGSTEYANAQAVERVLLVLHQEGQKWVSAKEGIQRLTSAGGSRTAWYRGKDRLRLANPPRLELRARIEDGRAVEYCRLLTVDRSSSISVGDWIQLTEQQKQLLRPKVGLFEGLETIALQMTSTDKLEEEIRRREHMDPMSGLSSDFIEDNRRWDPKWEERQARKVRPIDTEFLESLLDNRVVVPKDQPISSAGGPERTRDPLPPPSSRSKPKRIPSRRRAV